MSWRKGGEVIPAALLVILLVLAGSPGAVTGATAWLDEPEPTPHAVVHPGATVPASYEAALRTWKTPEDIAAWSGPRFAYDIDRALQLSETERLKAGGPPVFAPADMFERPSGTCLDLARFGLETLQRIDPTTQPKYLMLEFEPLHVQGRILRRHWLVSLRRGGSVYVFSDSKRPWLVDGPYESVGAFIEAYQLYRGRKIVRFFEAESYLRQTRKARAAPP
jgi:hypothetical protein